MVKGLGERLSTLEQSVSAMPIPKDGEKGEPGQDGKSITVADVQEFIVAEIERQVAERVKLIPVPENGKDGRDGVDGKDGANGIDGQKGADGLSVTLDDVLPVIRAAVAEEVKALPPAKDGKNGLDGTNGKDGRDGIDGAKGMDGLDGRDGKEGRHALQIQIQPSIDQNESYARGTFAMYKGGVIMASRSTDPITDSVERAGWDVVWNGVDVAQFVTQDNQRQALRITTTKGQTLSAELPGLVYRGVYREGEDYIKGDSATWAGSCWIAESNTKAKPGTPDSGWILAVKRGADGKEGGPPKDYAPTKPLKVG
jgi:hypothetical protein